MNSRSVGIHVSIAESIDLAVDRATQVGCAGTFQIFTCSPRRWAAKTLDESQIHLFQEKAHKAKFKPFAHMPYMPNLSSPDEKFYTESVDVLIREIQRCSSLGIRGFVVHFGSHMGSSIEEGHKRIALACKKAISATEKCDVRILLENSAGVRNSVGSRFEYIRSVLDLISDDKRTGVCFDTCHAFASGYDLKTFEAAQSTIENFDRAVGMKRLFLIHVNDSKGALGEASDRHEHIGLGNIGDAGFRAFFALKEVRNVPLILETPIDSNRDDKQDVAHVWKLVS